MFSIRDNVKRVFPWLCLVVISSYCVCIDALKMPSFFSDYMVLQTSKEYGARSFINGLASKAGEYIRLDIVGEKRISYSTVSYENKEFVFQLNPIRFRGLFDITVTDESGENITAHKVAIGTICLASFTELYGVKLCICVIYSGDVFFCSGQSNMVFHLKNSLYYKQEVEKLLESKKLPNLRLFTTSIAVNANGYKQPQFDFPPNGRCDAPPCNKWLDLKDAINGVNISNIEEDKSYIGRFSAVCYLTARYVSRFHTGDQPLGLVVGAAGGSPIESWTGHRGLSQCPSPVRSVPLEPSNRPDINAYASSSLYNVVWHPWKHFSIRAALWYQGEANAKLATTYKQHHLRRYYACMLKALIDEWRSDKGIGDFPFLVVQLAPSKPSTSSDHEEDGNHTANWNSIRLAQGDIVPRKDGPVDITGVAVTLDLGGSSGHGLGYLHPPNKDEVSRRLALQVVHVAYAKQGRVIDSDATNKGSNSSLWTGPVLSETLKLRDVQGINLDGSRAGCSKCCAGAPPFEVRLVGGLWSRIPLGDVSIDSQQNGVVLRLRSHQIEHLDGRNRLGLRYAYGDFVECVLVNEDNLPLAPFQHQLEVPISRVRAFMPQSAGEQSPPAPISSPPMGFNSWNYYHCNIDENEIKAIAVEMVANGMRDVGYEYINIDDCWQVGRDKSGRIIPDPVRFPSGIKALSDFIHSQGFKFGVYTARGSRTCQSRPGSYGFEDVDGETYCDWGLDYLKNDDCGGQGWRNKNESWIRFRKHFDACYRKTGRYTFLSVEYCRSVTDCGEATRLVANSWRTTGDIQANWASMMGNIHANNKLSSLAKPGHFNDPDMLTIGNVGMTFEEQKTQMSLWCVAGAPLLVGADVLNADSATIAVLTNTEVIRVNQDRGYQNRIQGILIGTQEDPVTGFAVAEVWCKHLSDGSKAVVLLNLDAHEARTVTLSWSMIGFTPAHALVRDLWARQHLGAFEKGFSAKVAAHGVVFIQVSQTPPPLPTPAFARTRAAENR